MKFELENMGRTWKELNINSRVHQKVGVARLYLPRKEDISRRLGGVS